MKIPRAPIDETDGWLAWKPISTIMRTDVPKVSARCTREALEAILATASSGIALVVDDAGKPIGIVRGDALSRAADTAAAAMEPVAFLLNESVPISLASAILASSGVHQIPIISAAQDAVGVLTAVDILSWVARQAGHRVIEATAHSAGVPETNAARDR